MSGRRASRRRRKGRREVSSGERGDGFVSTENSGRKRKGIIRTYPRERVHVLGSLDRIGEQRDLVDLLREPVVVTLSGVDQDLVLDLQANPQSKRKTNVSFSVPFNSNLRQAKDERRTRTSSLPSFLPSSKLARNGGWTDGRLVLEPLNERRSGELSNTVEGEEGGEGDDGLVVEDLQRDEGGGKGRTRSASLLPSSALRLPPPLSGND